MFFAHEKCTGPKSQVWQQYENRIRFSRSSFGPLGDYISLKTCLLSILRTLVFHKQVVFLNIYWTWTPYYIYIHQFTWTASMISWWIAEISRLSCKSVLLTFQELFIEIVVPPPPNQCLHLCHPFRWGIFQFTVIMNFVFGYVVFKEQ